MLQQNNDTESKNAKNEIQYNEHSDTNRQLEKKKRGKAKRHAKVKKEILYHAPQIESKLWCFNARELREYKEFF